MKFRTVLIIGLTMRLAIAPFFAHPFDIEAWYSNGENLLTGKQSILFFLRPYDYSFFLFVFPMTAIFNFLSHFIQSFTISASTLNPILLPASPVSIEVIPGLLFDILVKLPLICSDLFLAYFIHGIVLKYSADEKLAVFAASIWFLNPVSIWISSGWGMSDTLPALLTIIALFLVLERRFDWAALSIIVASALKFYAIVLLFPLLLIAWKNGGRKELIRSVAFTVVSSIVLLAPGLFSGVSTLGNLVTIASQSGIHYSGLSVWTAMTLFFPNFDQPLVSQAILASVLTGLYVWIWIRRDRLNSFSFIVRTFSLLIISLLLFYSFVGENFSIWLLPFLAIAVVKGIVSRKLYWILSAIALISSVTDSLLPFYMLPLSPWIGNWLISVLHLAAPYRVAPVGTIVQGVSFGKIFLSLLGVTFFATLILIGGRLATNSNNSNIGISDRHFHSANNRETSWGMCSDFCCAPVDTD